MSDLPELTVDGDPTDWLLWHTKTRGGRSTVYGIDDLPTVNEAWPTGDDGVFVRPLRVDDRVTLAHTYNLPKNLCGDALCGPVPFATATVTRIENGYTANDQRRVWRVTVSDVEPTA